MNDCKWFLLYPSLRTPTNCSEQLCSLHLLILSDPYSVHSMVHGSFFSHNANDVENVKYSENNSRYTHGYPMPLVLWIYLNVWFWPIASEATKIEVSWVANMTGICRSMTNKNRYTDGIKLYFFTHGVKSPLMGRQFFGVKWWLPIPASRCGSKEIGRPQTAGSIQILFGKSHPKVWGL